MNLIRITQPDGPLTPDVEQGSPIKTETGWTVEGFRTADGRYVERATRRKNVQWYGLADEIVNFWVKAYDCYNRLSCNPNHDTRDEAFAEFESKRDSGDFYFVQMGFRHASGSLVLNEWRKPSI